MKNIFSRLLADVELQILLLFEVFKIVENILPS